jgi:hypothetical protein
MKKDIVQRSISQLASALQNVVEQLPEGARIKVAQAIANSIIERTPIKEAVLQALSDCDSDLSELRAPR